MQANDPLLDAELTLELLADVADALKSTNEDLLLAWHALLSAGVTGHAFDHVFRTLRAAETTPSVAAAIPAIMDRLREHGCTNQAAHIANAAPSHPLALTYLLAWLPAAGGNSIIPPYAESGLDRASWQQSSAIRAAETKTAPGARSISTLKTRCSVSTLEYHFLRR